MKNTSLSLLLLLTITACKSNNGQLWEHKSIESDLVVDTTTTDTTTQYIDTVPQYDNSSHASSSSYSSSYSSSSSNHKTTIYDYAEKKTTDELEDEYYNVFGEDAFDHIDDEEYDAAELYELEYDD